MRLRADNLKIFRHEALSSSCLGRRRAADITLLLCFAPGNRRNTGREAFSSGRSALFPCSICKPLYLGHCNMNIFLLGAAPDAWSGCNLDCLQLWNQKTKNPMSLDIGFFNSLRGSLRERFGGLTD